RRHADRVDVVPVVALPGRGNGVALAREREQRLIGAVFPHAEPVQRRTILEAHEGALEPVAIGGRPAADVLVGLVTLGHQPALRAVDGERVGHEQADAARSLAEALFIDIGAVPRTRGERRRGESKAKANGGAKPSHASRSLSYAHPAAARDRAAVTARPWSARRGPGGCGRPGRSPRRRAPGGWGRRSPGAGC